MKEKHTDAILPAQHEGAEKNIEATIETSTSEEALQLFEDAKHRLFDVNNWDKICGKLSAVFQLTDEVGEEISGKPAVDNYFRIDIPGPGTIAGEGYDWVRVEVVEEINKTDDEQSVLITVRPSDNPTTDDDNIAHFFSYKSTSNFFISRKGNVVTAAVYGRNEVANTATTNAIDKTRNALVGTTAKAGLSDPQWKALVNGLLDKS